jgi:hypothetical protein
LGADATPAIFKALQEQFQRTLAGKNGAVANGTGGRNARMTPSGHVSSQCIEMGKIPSVEIDWCTEVAEIRPEFRMACDLLYEMAVPDPDKVRARRLYRGERSFGLGDGEADELSEVPSIYDNQEVGLAMLTLCRQIKDEWDLYGICVISVTKNWVRWVVDKSVYQDWADYKLEQAEQEEAAKNGNGRRRRREAKSTPPAAVSANPHSVLGIAVQPLQSCMIGDIVVWYDPVNQEHLYTIDEGTLSREGLAVTKLNWLLVLPSPDKNRAPKKFVAGGPASQPNVYHLCTVAADLYEKIGKQTYLQELNYITSVDNTLPIVPISTVIDANAKRNAAETDVDVAVRHATRNTAPDQRLGAAVPSSHFLDRDSSESGMTADDLQMGSALTANMRRATATGGPATDYPLMRERMDWGRSLSGALLTAGEQEAPEYVLRSLGVGGGGGPGFMGNSNPVMSSGWLTSFRKMGFHRVLNRPPLAQSRLLPHTFRGTETFQVGAIQRGVTQDTQVTFLETQIQTAVANFYGIPPKILYRTSAGGTGGASSAQTAASSSSSSRTVAAAEQERAIDVTWQALAIQKTRQRLSDAFQLIHTLAILPRDRGSAARSFLAELALRASALTQRIQLGDMARVIFGGLVPEEKRKAAESGDPEALPVAPYAQLARIAEEHGLAKDSEAAEKIAHLVLRLSDDKEAQWLRSQKRALLRLMVCLERVVMLEDKQTMVLSFADKGLLMVADAPPVPE